jgi:hypothetical protein
VALHGIAFSAKESPEATKNEVHPAKTGILDMKNWYIYKAPHP